ncbi:hypothetical protein L1276_004562 [Flavobacterium sp. HSC-32F16]|uniref:hypothetical protein n=1 Tax=Flavobacterium sp. HSC-32F16 TaxID=2910964 RepID=UPI0020A52530|nr:hypothetical protein [Flavobacterium sp. HSC-32F16]MCP2029375.1 hypothetical protein [Flavobacterium sp. HSC-32F16]
MNYTISIYLLLLFICTSCSKNIITTQKPQTKTNLSIGVNKPSLIFLHSAKAQNEQHNNLYRRFLNAFGDTSEFPIKSITSNTTVEFKNQNTTYFNDSKKNITGLILSDGIKAPYIEIDPNKYISAYEAYFGIKFNDKIYYQKEREELKNTNENRLNYALNSKFSINASYADNLIKNASSAHYHSVKKKKSICNSNTVYVYHYSDSLKTKKAPYYSYTKYNKNNYTENDVLTNDTGYKRESNYYYNNFNLLDSITHITTSDGKTEKNKSIYIYLQKEYFILSSEGKKTSVSSHYILNSKMQCINQETFNSYGNVMQTKSFKYDQYGRLIEEIEADRRSVYTYENPSSVFYSTCTSYEKEVETTKNIIYKKNGYRHYTNQYHGELNVYSKTLEDQNDCVQLIYTYNKDKKLTSFMEYLYK